VTVAALYDVHGNVPALDAVLAEPDVAAAEIVVFGGDVVAGPWPSETMERLRELGARTLWLHGNADRLPSAWAAEQLTSEQRRFLSELPSTQIVAVGGLGETLFCHGSPRSDEESITAVTSEERLRGILAGVEQRMVVCGHTHHQFDRRVEGKRVVNAGSVGMPYEGRAGAYWALLDREVDFRRSEYDVDAMLVALDETAYPEKDYLHRVLRDEIPSAQEAAEFFEQQALEQEAS
jgi:putative phosphoesterase